MNIFQKSISVFLLVTMGYEKIDFIYEKRTGFGMGGVDLFPVFFQKRIDFFFKIIRQIIRFWKASIGGGRIGLIEVLFIFFFFEFSLIYYVLIN